MKKITYPIWFISMIVLYQCSPMVRPAPQEPAFPLPEELRYLLPETVIPERYEVTIEHYVEAPIPYYYGEVRITIRCSAPTNGIVLNKAGGIKVKRVDVKLLPNADDTFTIKDEYNFAGNQWELVLDKPLEKDKEYEVYIEFHCDFYMFGTQGYSLEKYGTDSNRKVMTFTKLNEFDARKVIPCFDQINLKAMFKMRLLHPNRLTSFSNAAEKSREDITIVRKICRPTQVLGFAKNVVIMSQEKPMSYARPYDIGFFEFRNTKTQPNWVKVEFHETERMATFSIAMALAQFKTTGLHTESNVNVRTWADENVIDRMYYINVLASRSYIFFSRFFRVAHPLEKLDILILPEVEFEIEESFGIIFISQNYILPILENWSNIATYDLVLKICHAVSYQWIGSSVTMSQWKDTWFHQGLNYFLQKECAKKIFPEYPHDIVHLNMIESFLSFMRNEEMAIYGEPMKILKSYPQLQLLNDMTIEKVYHLIRMVQFITDPHLFKESLRDYVDEFKFRNSNVDQALDVFTKKAKSVDPNIFTFLGSGIQNIIESWLYQTRHPLIVAKRADSKKKLIFHQSIFNKFDLVENHEEHSNDKYWLIPLSCTTEKELKFDEVTPRVLLMSYQQQWDSPEELDKKDWFLCNLEFNVPGRVLYDKKTWKSIRKFLIDESKFKKINVLTRARLVSDMFTLAEAGQLTYEIVLRTMEYLQYEEELIPWMIALKEFDRIRSRLLGRDLARLERYQKFVGTILKRGFQKLLFEKFFPNAGEHSLENEFQMLFMEISCKFDFEECSKRSSEMNHIWNRISNLPLELTIQHRLHKVVLCEQVKHGNQETWKSLWQQYYEEQSQSLKENILQAFGCLQKEGDLQRLLEKSINDPQISREDRIIIFQSLVSNKKGYLLMKNFFKESYKTIISFNSEGESSELSYLRILFDATNKWKHYKEIENFAISKRIDTSGEVTHRSMDNANRNIMWGRRNKKDLKHSLRNIKLKKIFETVKNKFKFK